MAIGKDICLSYNIRLILMAEKCKEYSEINLKMSKNILLQSKKIVLVT